MSLNQSILLTRHLEPFVPVVFKVENVCLVVCSSHSSVVDIFLLNQFNSKISRDIPPSASLINFRVTRHAVGELLYRVTLLIQCAVEILIQCFADAARIVTRISFQKPFLHQNVDFGFA
jgi:hypothetical protein